MAKSYDLTDIGGLHGRLRTNVQHREQLIDADTGERTTNVSYIPIQLEFSATATGNGVSKTDTCTCSIGDALPHPHSNMGLYRSIRGAFGVEIAEQVRNMIRGLIGDEPEENE